MFVITHIDGGMDRTEDLDVLPALLAELASATDEHPDVAVVHESTTWGLSVFSGGDVSWEDLESSGPELTATGLSTEQQLMLMRAVAQGDLDFVTQFIVEH